MKNFSIYYIKANNTKNSFLDEINSVDLKIKIKNLFNVNDFEKEFIDNLARLYANNQNMQRIFNDKFLRLKYLRNDFLFFINF